MMALIFECFASTALTLPCTDMYMYIVMLFINKYVAGSARSRNNSPLVGISPGDGTRSRENPPIRIHMKMAKGSRRKRSALTSNPLPHWSAVIEAQNVIHADLYVLVMNAKRFIRKLRLLSAPVGPTADYLE